ncbi:DUF4235 domain-containing protein [Miniimonas sp. S16]|uniref:DUF4235 domain-containing protein n=1 Tax=Miniimonas sp. S16 TaxID=2171623 RepID=UPI000D5273E8|nr:DUF4235 domain-containing protein [Miniimonas sp. S16]
MNQQKIVQTVAVMAAGFVATRVLNLVWKRVFGHKPPGTVDDEQDSSLREIVLFAAVSGAIAALARAGATKAAVRFTDKSLAESRD